MVKVFISYIDETDAKVEGYFELLNPNDNGFTVFKTPKNILKIPVSRVLKIKEEIT